jgi:hypothetical protein
LPYCVRRRNTIRSRHLSSASAIREGRDRRLEYIQVQCKFLLPIGVHEEDVEEDIDELRLRI